MSIDKNQVNVKLKELIEKQTYHIDQLLDLLDLEKTVLLNQTETLHETAHNKQAQVEKLEQLTLAHQQLLADSGFDNDEAGMEACLKWCSSSADLLELWTSLKEKIKACKKGNLTNGALLEMNRFKIDQLLNIITQGNNGRSTYDAGGQSTQDQNKGSLSIKA